MTYIKVTLKHKHLLLLHQISINIESKIILDTKSMSFIYLITQKEQSNTIKMTAQCNLFVYSKLTESCLKIL